MPFLIYFCKLNYICIHVYKIIIAVIKFSKWFHYVIEVVALIKKSKKINSFEIKVLYIANTGNRTNRKIIK